MPPSPFSSLPSFDSIGILYGPLAPFLLPSVYALHPLTPVLHPIVLGSPSSFVSLFFLAFSYLSFPCYFFPEVVGLLVYMVFFLFTLKGSPVIVFLKVFFSPPSCSPPLTLFLVIEIFVGTGQVV